MVERPQERAVFTLSSAGSPRGGFGVICSVPGVRYLAKAGSWVCRRQDQLSKVAGGRQSTEAAKADSLQGRSSSRLPCFQGERVVASTEQKHGHAGSTQSPT